MLVDKKDPSEAAFDVPIEVDAPPAYDALSLSAAQPMAPHSPVSSGSTNLEIAKGCKSTSTVVQPSCQNKLIRPTAGPSNVPPRALSAKTQADVRDTVRGLIRDVVYGSSPVRSSVSAVSGVLDSCAAACASHSLSLARILQERNIEHHSLLYWAIISRASPPAVGAGSTKPADREDDAFVLALISRAAPLSPAGMSDLRAACLVSADNTFFQRLRSVPGVVSLSGADRMLLAGSGLHANAERGLSSVEKYSDSAYAFGDTVHVRQRTVGKTESFSVELQLKLFQRRMRVSGEISIEFIARGRIWLLIFFTVPPLPTSSSSSSSRIESTNNIPATALAVARARSLTPGSWAVALALLEGSTQCYAEAALFVEELEAEPNLPDSSEQSRTATPMPLSDGTPHSAKKSPLHTRQTSVVPDHQVLSSSSRSRNEDEDISQEKPPITMILTSYAGRSPLIALPPTPNPPNLIFPGETGSSLNSNSLSKSKESNERKMKEEKRADWMPVAIDRMAREAREARQEREERARMLDSVLLAEFEEAASSHPGKGNVCTAGELMYDGCPYIAPDGTLRAVLEVHLSRSSTMPRNAECVIC